MIKLLASTTNLICKQQKNTHTITQLPIGRVQIAENSTKQTIQFLQINCEGIKQQMIEETLKTYQLQCMILIRFNKQIAKISYKIIMKTLNADWIIIDVQKLF